MANSQNASATKKRILSITIKRMVDDSPDTSYLGEYSGSPDSEFSIDRAHDLDCIVNSLRVYDPHTLYECGICGSMHRWEFDGDCREDSERYAGSDDYAERNKLTIPDADIPVLSWEDRQNADKGCDCGRGTWNNREYRYFNPASIDKNNAPEENRDNARKDYDRMESLNAGNWCYIGISARAEVQLTPEHVQKITSGGLWGIESDSGKDYLESVEQEELSSLKSELTALGFSKRAIAKAFQNIERKDA